MSRRTSDYLRHILDETAYLRSVSQGLKREQFLTDGTLKRACVRSLEIIGEAVKNLPADFRQDHCEIEWRLLAGMRDRLIHQYFGVDYEVVWDAITQNIPELDSQVRQILADQVDS